MRQRALGYSGNVGDALSRDAAPVDRIPFSQAIATQDAGLTQFLKRDQLLLGACLICALLIGYQLGVTLLHPPWTKPATDWLRVATAWPELALVMLISLRFTRARRPGAATWWMLSLALLCHAVARTWWTVDDLLVYPMGVPFPILPDLILVLQYPFFFLAVVLLPCIHPWVPRLRVILDALLWMSTATALSWYFILKHIPVNSSGSPAGSFVCLAYPIGDLVVFFGLAVAMTRPSRSLGDRWALYILSVAFMCLFTADSWVAVVLRNPQHVYAAGGPPDLFWTAFYVLVPLAGLVQLRLVRYERPQSRKMASGGIQWRDVLVSIRALIPFTATLVASAVIMVYGDAAPSGGDVLMLPITRRNVSLGLLLLATVRQVVVSLEYEQLRREQATARAHEEALIEANHRMEEFLGIVSHELRTPLTSLSGNIQLMARRMDTLAGVGVDGELEDRGRDFTMARGLVQGCESSLGRIGRLVNELLDDALIRAGQLEVEFVPCDLITVVGEAIKEQRLLAPTRTIHLVAPDADSILVFADANRLVQVVNNYVSNALKYSREDQPVEVRVRVMSGMGGVCVCDAGVGLPMPEQDQIWERFHRAAGVAVQSGSDVGLGIGLHISKAIIERHGGRVGVQSALGRGSTFWFTLPLAGTPLSESDGRSHVDRNT